MEAKVFENLYVFYLYSLFVCLFVFASLFVLQEQFVKAKVHSQGWRMGRFPEVEPAPRLFWIWILMGFSGMGRAGKYTGVVPNGGCFQSFG